MQERALVVEAVSVEAVGAGDAPAEPRARDARATRRRRSPRRCACSAAGSWHDAALVVREAPRPGAYIDGPAIIAERNATTVVEPGWRRA